MKSWVELPWAIYVFGHHLDPHPIARLLEFIEIWIPRHAQLARASAFMATLVLSLLLLLKCRFLVLSLSLLERLFTCILPSGHILIRVSGD